MERIIERFKELAVKLESDEPPEREFYLRYPDEMAEDMFETGILSRSKWNEHQKKPLAEIGDWNCSYCDWKGVCYPQGIFTIPVEDGKLTIDEALANYSVGE